MNTPYQESAAVLDSHLIHASLYRPVLFAGAEPAVAALEAATAFALLFVVGVHVATVLLATFYLTVVHTLMVWVAKQDPHMTALYLRSVRARDHYLALGDARHGASVVYPAIPRKG